MVFSTVTGPWVCGHRLTHRPKQAQAGRSPRPASSPPARAATPCLVQQVFVRNISVAVGDTGRWGQGGVGRPRARSGCYCPPMRHGRSLRVPPPVPTSARLPPTVAPPRGSSPWLLPMAPPLWLLPVAPPLRCRVLPAVSTPLSTSSPTTHWSTHKSQALSSPSTDSALVPNVDGHFKSSRHQTPRVTSPCPSPASPGHAPRSAPFPSLL